MKFLRIGAGDMHTDFYDCLHQLGQFAPSTVAACDVDFDAENGVEGYVLLSFGAGYGKDRLINPGMAAKMAGILNTNLYKLSEMEQERAAEEECCCGCCCDECEPDEEETVASVKETICTLKDFLKRIEDDMR